jgi:NADP-dependent 3-hydroxy acid dehydrogenase YdfG
MNGIEGTVVAITGASSGIGEATALRLADAGAKVVLGARRTDRLEQLAARIGEGAAFTAVDVTRRADVEGLVALARERFGRLDVIVNNAGIGPIAPLEALHIDEWDAMIDVNLRGVLHGIAAALPAFLEQGSGHVVNTTSTAAHRIVPSQAVYAATKTAVSVVSEGLRQESGGRFRVTVVSPGFVGTDFADSISDPEVRAQIVERRDAMAIPPDAIARAIAYAIEQPDDVDVGEIIVRPTAQG